MPTLYTMPETCAIAPNIAVHWLGAPIEIEVLKRGEQNEDAYLAINPKGQVPAVKFEDGDVLTEAAAILAWLGAEYGKDSYARDTVLGRKEAEALSYLSSEVHAAYGAHFAPRKFADDKNTQEKVKAKTYEKLRGHYERMNETVEKGGGWYLGKRSFADAYLYAIERWIEGTPLKISDYPALQAHRRRMEEDEKVLAALKAQKMKPAG